MMRTTILGDLLSVLFERDQLSRLDRDKRDIYALCNALVSVEGDVSGHKLAASVISRYRTLKNKQRNKKEQLTHFSKKITIFFPMR